MRLSLFCQDICLYPLSPTVNRASMSRIQMHTHFRKNSPFIPRAGDTGLSLRAGLNLQKLVGPVLQWKSRSRWLRIWPSTPEPPRLVFVTHNSATPTTCLSQTNLHKWVLCAGHSFRPKLLNRPRDFASVHVFRQFNFSQRTGSKCTGGLAAQIHCLPC